jgi:hypothetical protein
MVRRPSAFKMRDVARALKAAKLADVTASVDILRDGTLRLTPITGPQDQPKTNEWDDVLGKPALPLHQ